MYVSLQKHLAAKMCCLRFVSEPVVLWNAREKRKKKEKKQARTRSQRTHSHLPRVTAISTDSSSSSSLATIGTHTPRFFYEAPHCKDKKLHASTSRRLWHNLEQIADRSRPDYLGVYFMELTRAAVEALLVSGCVSLHLKTDSEKKRTENLFNPMDKSHSMA